MAYFVLALAASYIKQIIVTNMQRILGSGNSAVIYVWEVEKTN